MNNSSNLLAAGPYSQQSFSQTLLINVIRIVFGFTALIGNGFILYTMGRNPSLRKNLCNMLIGVLAFADFWTGIGFFYGSSVTLSFQLIPFYTYTTGQCLISQYMGMSGIQMSQIATIFIALDRLKAVKDPWFYSSQDRVKRFSLALSVTVIYSLIVTALIFVGINFNSYPLPTFCNAGTVLNHHYIQYWLLFAIVVAIIVIICYISTTRTMTKKLTEAKSDRLVRELAKQRAVFKTVTLVLVVYGLCWCLPNFILLVATVGGAGPALLGEITPLIAVGTGVYSSANVVIYAWKHNELGAAMRQIFSNRKETVTTISMPSVSVRIQHKKRATESAAV